MTNPGGIEHENKPSSLPGARPKVAIHGSRRPKAAGPFGTDREISASFEQEKSATEVG